MAVTLEQRRREQAVNRGYVDDLVARISSSVVDLGPYTVGDGAADDLAGILAASAAAGDGGVLRFRPGATYLISSSLFPTTENQVWIGDGATIKAAPEIGGSTYVMRLSAGTHLRGLTVDCNAADQSALSAGINASAEGVVVEKCKVINPRVYGIVGHNSSYIRLLNNHIVIADGDGHHIACTGIFMQDALDGGIQGCEIIGNFIDAATRDDADTGSGLLIAGGATVPALDYLVHGNRVRFPDDPDTTGMVLIELRDLVGGACSGNRGRGGRIGISYAGTDGMPCAGNSMKAVESYCYEVAASSNISLTGNAADGADDAGTAITDYGFAVQGTACDHILIAGNTVSGVLIDGVRLTNAGHPHCKVNGNIIKLAAAATGYGIEALGGCDDFSASNNDIEGDAASALRGIYSNGGSRVSIRGNQIRNFLGPAVRIESGAGVETDIEESGNSQSGCTALVEWTTSGGGSFGDRARRRSGTLAQRPSGLGTDATGFKYFDTTLVATMEWTGTAWRAEGRIILGRSGAAVTHTGDTAETVLATITVPANSMGTKGTIIISKQWGGITNSANAKTTRDRFGGIAGTAHNSVTNVSIVSARHQTIIQNRNLTNSQIGGANAATSGGWIQSTAAIVTGAVDTTAAVDIVLSVQLASAGETITLESYMVELIPG